MKAEYTHFLCENMSFTLLLDLLGTFAFAISGIRLASKKQIDWFGAYVVGLVTAIGGGTTRDLLLNQTPFWITDETYFLMTGVALLAAVLFKEKLFRWGSALFLFDALGLGLFTVVGISKSLDAGMAPWVCIVMGAITGSVGGVIRDVLLNEVPLLFRKDIYALTCISGGLVYFGGQYVGLATNSVAFLAAVTIVVLRLLAVKYAIHLPVLRDTNSPQEKER